MTIETLVLAVGTLRAAEDARRRQQPHVSLAKSYDANAADWTD